VTIERTVAVLLVPGASMFLTAVPLSVFANVPAGPRVPRYRLLAVGQTSGAVTTAGITMRAPYELSRLAEADVVIVPAWSDPAVAPSGQVLAALRTAHARGAVVVGLCLGAFVLAHAGLLDGRPATTHWSAAPAFARMFPTVRLDPRVLYIDDGDVLTSAGSAAGIDCCLHLIRREAGAEVANTVARMMVVPPHRTGGQAQFIDLPVPADSEDAALSAAMGWAVEHLDQRIGIDDLAGRAHLSRRSFDRRFVRLTGSTALQWLQAQRVLLARHLLETTDLSVDQIAARVGFSGGVSLRPVFRDLVGVSPRSYRQSFRRADQPPR
jgi:transcriptional regulator GlxA family with amidase domain